MDERHIEDAMSVAGIDTGLPDHLPDAVARQIDANLDLAAEFFAQVLGETLSVEGPGIELPPSGATIVFIPTENYELAQANSEAAEQAEREGFRVHRHIV